MHKGINTTLDEGQTPVLTQAFPWPIDVADPITANEGATYTHEGKGNFRLHNVVEHPAIAFDTTQITHPENRSNPQPGDPCHLLAAQGHPPAVAFSGEDHAGTSQADARSLLRALRHAVGEEAFAEWGSRVLDPLQSPEILRAWMHGGVVRNEADQGGTVVDDGALARAKGVPAGALLWLWRYGPDGRSPQGRELAEQLARELGTSLPQLPHEGAPASAVRRLTPTECEKLQGFPPGWTDVPYRNKPAADGPRYKALGNSMAVPCMAWLGQRIAMVDALSQEGSDVAR